MAAVPGGEGEGGGRGGAGLAQALATTTPSASAPPLSSANPAATYPPTSGSPPRLFASASRTFMMIVWRGCRRLQERGWERDTATLKWGAWGRKHGSDGKRNAPHNFADFDLTKVDKANFALEKNMMHPSFFLPHGCRVYGPGFPGSRFWGFGVGVLGFWVLVYRTMKGLGCIA